MIFERIDRLPAQTNRARSLRRRMTRSEKTLWLELRKLDCNFRRQAPIGRYFADFASHGRRLVIEVDGGVHERLDDVILRDAERQRWMEDEGYTVLRFTDRLVSDDVEACIEAVRAALGLARDDMGFEVTPTPMSANNSRAPHAPPSPALRPSRRKGA